MDTVGFRSHAVAAKRDGGAPEIPREPWERPDEGPGESGGSYRCLLAHLVFIVCMARVSFTLFDVV